MDLTDIPVVGGVISVGAVFGDLLFYGGEMFVSLVLFALIEPTTWVSIVLYLQTLASRVSWLPEGKIGSVVVLALVLVITVSTIRFIDRWRESRA